MQLRSRAGGLQIDGVPSAVTDPIFWMAEQGDALVRFQPGFPDFLGSVGWLAGQGNAFLGQVTREAASTSQLAVRTATRATTQVTAKVGEFLAGVVDCAAKAVVSTNPDEDKIDNQRLRTFLRDALWACGTPVEFRAQALRKVLKEHPETVEWLLQRRDMKQFLESADVEIGEMSPALPAFMQSINDVLPPGECKELGRNVIVRSLAPVPYELVMSQMPDAVLLSLADQVNQKIETFRFAQHPTVQKLIDPEVGINLDDVPERIKGLITSVLLPFFDELPIADKRRVARAFLELPPFAPLSDKMSAVLLNLGQVAVLKLFQLVGKEAKSDLIKEAMQKLLKGLPKMPAQQVQLILAKDLGCRVEDLKATFPEFDYEKTLGVGTIGQVHRARVRMEDGAVRPCVVKVLKPNLRPGIEAEFATLFRLTKDPFVRALLKDARASLLEEIDLTQEGRNMQSAPGAYLLPQKGIYPCGLIKGIEPTENVLVMELAPGRPLADWDPKPGQVDQVDPLEAVGISRSTFLNMKRRALEELLRVNLVNYVWGEGESALIFPDAHAGNMLLDPRPGDRPDYRLTLIDWGVVARPEKKDQEGLKLIGSAVVMHSQPLGNYLATGRVALAGLKLMADVTPEQEALFLREAPALMSGEGSYVKKIVDVLTWTIDAGVKLRAPSMQFNRGRKFLEDGLKEVEAEMNRLDPEGKDKQLVRPDIDQVYQRCATKEVILDWVRRPQHGVRDMMAVASAMLTRPAT